MSNMQTLLLNCQGDLMENIFQNKINHVSAIQKHHSH